MSVKKEIYEAFKLMRLSSEEQRKSFEKMNPPEEKSKQPRLFISLSNQSDKIEVEG